MKSLMRAALIFIAWLIPCSITHAAQVVFTIPGGDATRDGAVVVEMRVLSDEYSLNALEGVIGFLGEGSQHISRVVIETGDSAFDLWPVSPEYDSGERAIRFTGGSTKVLTPDERVFRVRLFSNSTKPVIVSWLGGYAYRNDGFGTQEGVLSRSLVVNPEISTPNIIRASSEDSTPPHIESAIVSSDIDTNGGRPFVSIFATDDVSGISHYEITEDGDMTRVVNGDLYFIKNPDTTEPLLVVVYDNAGNSSSVKISAHKFIWSNTIVNSVVAVVSILVVCLVWVLRRSKIHM